MIGEKLGHYQILEKLGQGGMGVVYKARDTHLDRFVALKILPPDRVADPERRRRFIQEAKSASALHHPNIVVIHDIASERGIDYIAMEYIDGKPLDRLIPAGGMRLNDALRIAIPIADALAQAHAAGITHRDLKPSNVMTDKDGRAKLLDFGLAKLTDRTETGEDDATLTDPKNTAEGAILGTVAYMSPEQAEGKKIDSRSDIFALGALLYEMISGRRAFEGDTPASTLGAVIHKDPAPLTQLVPVTPANSNRRFEGTSDVRVALEEIREESESGKLSAPVAAPPRRAWALPLLASAVVGGGVVSWLALRSPESPAPEPVLTQLTRDSGYTGDPAISADGKVMAYVSDRAGGGPGAVRGIREGEEEILGFGLQILVLGGHHVAFAVMEDGGVDHLESRVLEQLRLAQCDEVAGAHRVEAVAVILTSEPAVSGKRPFTVDAQAIRKSPRRAPKKSSGAQPLRVSPPRSIGIAFCAVQLRRSFEEA